MPKTPCPLCERLVPIVPGRWKPGNRQQWWWMAEHQDESGNDCDGSKRPL